MNRDDYGSRLFTLPRISVESRPNDAAIGPRGLRVASEASRHEPTRVVDVPSRLEAAAVHVVVILVDWSSNQSYSGFPKMAVLDAIQPARIVIADDHPISRDGLRRLLESEPGLIVVGETGDGSEAITLVRDQRADILLLDFPFCRQPTLDTLRDIAVSEIDVRTILLAERVDSLDLTKALQLSAKGVVLKDSAAEVLFKSIRSVMTGHYWIGSGHVLDLPAGLRKLNVERRRRRTFGLTLRELEIVRAVVEGHSNKEIAQRLSITENTVKSHLMRIFNKLGASNRVELALFARHHHLIDEI